MLIGKWSPASSLLLLINIYIFTDHLVRSLLATFLSVCVCVCGIIKYLLAVASIKNQGTHTGKTREREREIATTKTKRKTNLS